MITVKTTEAQRAKAKELAEPLTRRYRNNSDSIRKGEGIYTAKLAELVVAETFGWNYIDTVHSDHEAVLENGEKKKVELKVKERTVPPRGDYNGTVAAANTKQQCDYYLFCSTVGDEQVHIVGILPKDEFLQKAVFNQKGELDPNGPRGQNWKFRADCYNMPYSAMKRVGTEPLR